MFDFGCAQKNRPYFALGAGKSTLEVGARTLLHCEAQQFTDSSAVLTVLIDISKCFDIICWNRVLKAAAEFDFPTPLLKLCLAMYYAPRRIRWGSAHSYAVQVQKGVLPGCSVAMFLLQLVMMLPFDVFQKSFSTEECRRYHTADGSHASGHCQDLGAAYPETRSSTPSGRLVLS